MKRRFLSLCPAAAAVAFFVAQPNRAAASVLDPTSTTSLGAFPTTAGTYTFNTNGPTPTLSGPGGTFNGVLLTDQPGHTMAVFDFDSISIGSGIQLIGGGANPIALLSRGDFSLTGTGQINLSGGNGGTGTSVGAGGPGGGSGGQGGQAGTSSATPGSGPGGGSQSGLGSGTGAGGGFGGKGGDGFPNAGGPAYGPPLTSLLQGGSGGGGGLGVTGPGGAGGGGGGALEIGAVGNITLGGLGILVNGGNGGSAPLGGGGSGGGLLIHSGLAISLSGALSANGGNGGGGGGGGMIFLRYGTDFTNTGTISVLGGSGTSQPGANGIISVASVPEPSSIVLSGLGFVGLLGVYGRKRRIAHISD